MKRLWKNDMANTPNPRDGKKVRREGRQRNQELHAISFRRQTSPKFSGVTVITGRVRGIIKQLVHQADRRRLRQFDQREIDIIVADEIEMARRQVQVDEEYAVDFFARQRKIDEQRLRWEESCYDPDEMYHRPQHLQEEMESDGDERYRLMDLGVDWV